MALDYGAPPVATDLLSPGPPRGLLVHLAATVRGRLEGASEVPDVARIVPRVRRAAWALEVAGVGLFGDPVGVLEWLDLTADEEGTAGDPWSTWSPGEEVPPEARSRDLARGLGVVRYRLEDALATAPEACRTAALEGAWIVGQCLGVRALLGPIGRDEVERMRDRAGHAWRPARGGVVG
ncbi:hypothetical protein [Elioraea tepidiphila]|uniref:hypothetical protein n=1 Tax=Elioraea tepidiphila TaxID=457934 RepID=UPI002FDB246B